MSNVRGRIAVDVQFTDSTTSEGVQSLKTITLQDATEYTTGKVAIATGVCGTEAVSVNLLSSTYKDASGSNVTFSAVRRLAFAASGVTKVKCDSDLVDGTILISSNLSVAVSDVSTNAFQVFIALIDATAGTASYTLVLYGT